MAGIFSDVEVGVKDINGKENHKKSLFLWSFFYVLRLLLRLINALVGILIVGMIFLEKYFVSIL